MKSPFVDKQHVNQIRYHCDENMEITIDMDGEISGGNGQETKGLSTQGLGCSCIWLS